MRFSPHLKGITVPNERVPSMIDEFPILSVVAAFAQGRTHFQGVSELRMKESDRITTMTRALSQMGLRVYEGGDWYEIHGHSFDSGKVIQGGIECAVNHDHRMAMSFLCMGMATNHPIAIDDGTSITTSFPDFIEKMNTAGSNIIPFDTK